MYEEFKLLQGERTGVSSVLEVFPADVTNNLRRMSTLLAYQDHLPRRISLVSALRREGVTYVSLVLGAVLASDLAIRVCVVDLNWGASDLLGHYQRAMPPDQASDLADRSLQRPGLADILYGGAGLDDVIMPTALPQLSLVPAGTLPEVLRPLVARSRTLRGIIGELEDRFDLLVLDAPALLHTSDAIALASLGEACCVVVRQGVTHLNTVRRALDEIKHLKVLGVILNRVYIHTPQLIRNFVPQE